MKNQIILEAVKALREPKPGSHKGDNGKLLIVGGSANATMVRCSMRPR